MVLVPLEMAAAAPVLLPGWVAAVVASSCILASVYSALQRYIGRGDVDWALTPPRAGSVELTPTELVVRRGNHREHFRREEILGAWIEAHPALDLVIQLPSGVVARVGLVDPEDGERVLALLGLAHDPRAVTLRLGSPRPDAVYGRVAQRTAETMGLVGCGVVPVLLAVGFVVIFYLNSSHGSSSLLGMGILVAFALALLVPVFSSIRARIPAAPSVVRVGSEGVEVLRGRSRRWVAFSELSSVDTEGGALVLVLRGKKQVRIDAANEAEASAVRGRIEAARSWMDRAGSAEPLGALERRGQAVGEWLRRVRSLGAMREGAYREAFIDEEMLARVAENPTAPAEQRIGAAVALSSGAERESRRRLRVVAEATASPRLRVALERASVGRLSEAEAEAALDEAKARDLQAAEGARGA